MDHEYVQHLRYKLQKRFRRLNSVGYQTFHFSLRQFFGFLEHHQIFMGILEYLERRYHSMKAEAEKIVRDQEPRIFDNELEAVAASYFVLKECIALDNQLAEVEIGYNYGIEPHHNDAIDHFKTMFVEPLYEYIDEQLDDQRAILALLRRYKHKCEWFQQDSLYAVWESDTTRGEKHLALHLYEYLHDQGLDFMIEPSSVSGEADLIAAQKSDDPLIADAKIFNPEKGKGSDYIVRGFHQIYQYTVDYNEPFGYLIIYKTCENDLRFTLSKQMQSTPFIIHNNKTIFLICIDIFPHKVSASKRGPLRVLEISEERLIQLIKAEQDAGI